MKKIIIVQLILASILGIAIALIDSQPNWDDAGISAVMILFVASIFGFFVNEKPWLVAIVVSIWIPMYSIFVTHNYGGTLALAPGFIGSYLGYFIKWSIRK